MIPVAMMIQAARGPAKNWDSIPKDMMGLPPKKIDAHPSCLYGWKRKFFHIWYYLIGGLEP